MQRQRLGHNTLESEVGRYTWNLRSLETKRGKQKLREFLNAFVLWPRGDVLRLLGAEIGACQHVILVDYRPSSYLNVSHSMLTQEKED